MVRGIREKGGDTWSGYIQRNALNRGDHKSKNKEKKYERNLWGYAHEEDRKSRQKQTTPKRLPSEQLRDAWSKRNDSARVSLKEGGSTGRKLSKKQGVTDLSFWRLTLKGELTKRRRKVRRFHSRGSGKFKLEESQKMADSFKRKKKGT